MPELPEVETIKNTLEAHIKFKVIDKVICYLPKIIQNDFAEFEQAVLESRIINLKRIGKYLFLYLDNSKALVIHLRMTGQLLWVNSAFERDKHTHIEIYFKDLSGKLIYRDIRQFGKFEVINQSEIASYIENRKLATDALIISDQEFYANLSKKRKYLKTTLLDQSVIAGLGNIYADEVLYLDKLSPKRIATTITKDEAHQLLNIIKSTLDTAIKEKGTSISDYFDTNGKKGNFQNFLKVYQKQGMPCSFCGNLIVAEKFNGRNTRYCPNCQK